MKSKLIITLLLISTSIAVWAQKPKMIVISPKQTQQAEKLYNSGLEKYNKKAYSAAINDLKASLNINAELTDAYKLLASAYQANQQKEEAIKVLTTFVEKSNSKDSAYFLLAKAYFNNGQYTEAINNADKRIAYNDTNFKVY